jgi:site-specific DNA recombinase
MVKAQVTNPAALAKKQKQVEYNKKYNELVDRYDEDKKQYDQTCNTIQHRNVRAQQMDFFIEGLKRQGILQNFDAELWCSLV